MVDLSNLVPQSQKSRYQKVFHDHYSALASKDRTDSQTLPRKILSTVDCPGIAQHSQQLIVCPRNKKYFLPHPKRRRDDGDPGVNLLY